MNKEFAPHEPSLDLKELGFDEPCLAYYNKKELFSFTQVCNEPLKGHYIKMSNRLCAPTFSQAFRWFREKYKIRFIIQSSMSDLGEFFKVIFPNGEQRGVSYNTYEEAELACLKQLIEIVKNK